MKKSIFVAGFVFWAIVGSAQVTNKKEPPPPPAPPKPSISKFKHVPPPPPPPVPAEPPAPDAPPPPPEPPMPPEQELPEDYVAFLKQNPSVASLHWNAGGEVIVRLKSGKEERYNLNNESSRKAVEAKYGELPTAPPPPPPPPPAPEPPIKKKKKTTLS